jgi:hypothetical protein
MGALVKALGTPSAPVTVESAFSYTPVNGIANACGICVADAGSGDAFIMSIDGANNTIYVQNYTGFSPTSTSGMSYSSNTDNFSVAPPNVLSLKMSISTDNVLAVFYSFDPVTEACWTGFTGGFNVGGTNFLPNWTHAGICFGDYSNRAGNVMTIHGLIITQP